MKPIQGFEGTYSATEHGYIFAHPRKGKGGHRGKILKSWKIGNGYEVISLYRNTQKQKKYLVHRLIATAYIPNPNNLPEVNHKNGNKTDNRPENLEWCTSKENKNHAWAKGLYTHKGTKHYLAKLTEKDVRDIRNSFQGLFGEVAKIAKKYGVADATIHDIVEYKTWKHLDN